MDNTHVKLLEDLIYSDVNLNKNNNGFEKCDLNGPDSYLFN
jgi:hypothetical protein